MRSGVVSRCQDAFSRSCDQLNRSYLSVLFACLCRRFEVLQQELTSSFQELAGATPASVVTILFKHAAEASIGVLQNEIEALAHSMRKQALKRDAAAGAWVLFEQLLTALCDAQQTAPPTTPLPLTHSCTQGAPQVRAKVQGSQHPTGGQDCAVQQRGATGRARARAR